MSEGPVRRRLAYVLAPSHSGSTLLAMLLGSHPDVATVGELNLSAIDDRDRYICSCGQPLRSCPFWKRISAGMGARGIRFDVTRAGTDYRHVPSAYARRLLQPLHRGRLLEACRDAGLAMSRAWRRTVPEVQARNAELVDCISRETGAAVVVDSSKIGVRLKYLLRNPRLDVRVIRLIRDGRAVAVSYVDPAAFADARDPRLRGGGTGGSRQGERLPMPAAAREWRRSQEEAAAIIRRLPPSQWIETRYEWLCEHTEDTLRAIFRFLGVDPDRGRPGFRSAGQHVIGNGMRLDTAADVRLDMRWMRAFTERERARFEPVAGALNRRLGYAEERVP
jgi:Sulfotransferase family